MLEPNQFYKNLILRSTKALRATRLTLQYRRSHTSINPPTDFSH